MHSFLKVIGFDQIKTRADLEKLISYILEEASERRVYRTKEGILFSEMSMEFAEGIGVTIRGEYDNNEAGKFRLEHYFPYVRGHHVSVREEVYISKRVDTDAFTGMCDDYRIGVSLIFYLQNVIPYLEKSAVGYEPAVYPVTLSALALNGTIILPTMQDEKITNSIRADANHRTQLIAEAKKGNQEAIDSLTIDDIDLYATVSKRIRTEDVYSIVDTSFTARNRIITLFWEPLQTAGSLKTAGRKKRCICCPWCVTRYRLSCVLIRRTYMENRPQAGDSAEPSGCRAMWISLEICNNTDMIQNGRYPMVIPDTAFFC